MFDWELDINADVNVISLHAFSTEVGLSLSKGKDWMKGKTTSLHGERKTTGLATSPLAIDASKNHLFLSYFTMMTHYHNKNYDSFRSEWTFDNGKNEKLLLVTEVFMCAYCQVGLLNESVSAC